MKINMPEIATTKEVQNYLKVPASTLYRWMSSGDFVKGVYLGRGRFNLSRLKTAIEQGTFLARRKS